MRSNARASDISRNPTFNPEHKAYIFPSKSETTNTRYRAFSASYVLHFQRTVQVPLNSPICRMRLRALIVLLQFRFSCVSLMSNAAVSVSSSSYATPIARHRCAPSAIVLIFLIVCCFARCAFGRNTRTASLHR